MLSYRASMPLSNHTLMRLAELIRVALADDVHAAVERASRLAHTLLDGTLIPIDRLADERPHYSGKHKQDGMNMQLLADPAVWLVWA